MNEYLLNMYQKPLSAAYIFTDLLGPNDAAQEMLKLRNAKTRKYQKINVIGPNLSHISCGYK